MYFLLKKYKKCYTEKNNEIGWLKSTVLLSVFSFPHELYNSYIISSIDYMDSMHAIHCVSHEKHLHALYRISHIFKL